MTPKQQAEALIAMYQAAEAALELLIARGVKSGAAGTVRYRRVVQSRVQRILRVLERRAVPAAEALVRNSYQQGSKTVSGALEGFGQPDQQSVGILTDNLTQRLKDGHTIVGRRVDDVFRREGLKAVAVRMAAAGQAKDAAQQLVHALEAQGVKAFTDKGGRNWSLSAYASMAVRTTARQAHSQGVVNQMLRLNQDLVDVSSHPHKSDACDKYDGKTFSLAGGDKEFPKLDQLPPFHPNCKHVLKPSRESFKRRERELGLA